MTCTFRLFFHMRMHMQTPFFLLRYYYISFVSLTHTCTHTHTHTHAHTHTHLNGCNTRTRTCTHVVDNRYQAKCLFAVVNGTLTGVSLGGDGSNPNEAALSCAVLNGAAPNGWGKPAGVYWVSLENTMAATDTEDIVQVRCQGGQQVNGDGSDYRAPVTSCAGLVTDFEENVYDLSTGLPNRYWQAISPTINIALMPNPVGPAMPTASSMLTGSPQFNAPQGNDGQPDQGGDFVHGGGSGETNPRFTLQLAAQAQVTRVVLYLRNGACASRNMDGTGCTSAYNTNTYSAANQGFTVVVGSSPCEPNEPCPGTVCQWVRQMTQSSVYTITCPNGTIGNYVSFQLPGTNRTSRLHIMF